MTSSASRSDRLHLLSASLRDAAMGGTYRDSSDEPTAAQRIELASSPALSQGTGLSSPPAPRPMRRLGEKTVYISLADRSPTVSSESLSFGSPPLQLPLRASLTSPEPSLKYQMRLCVEDGLRIAKRLQEPLSSPPEDPEERFRQLLEQTIQMDRLVTAFLDEEKRRSEMAPSSPGKIPLFTLVHELRTPLQNLIALFHTPPEERASPFFAHLVGSYQRLSQLLDDIPDSDQDIQLACHPGPFDLTAFCEGLEAQISSYAKERNVHVRFSVPLLFQQHLISDKHRIGQILINFISNAIKYSNPNGYVDVRIEIDPNRQIVKFQVQDYGKGISHQDRQKLFIPFSQIKEDPDACCPCCPPWLSSLFKSKSAQIHTPSSGVGLYFCKTVAELLNEGQDGCIGVESSGVPGEGSNFWFTIPLRTAPKSEPLPPTPAPIALSLHPHLKILAADDSLVTRKMMKMALKTAEVYQEAVDGQDAFEKFEQAAETDPFNVVILDCEMPRLGGIEAAQKIRQMALPKQPHIFILSGHDPSSIEKRVAQIDRRILILQKPIFPNHLIETINAHTDPA